MTQHDEQRGIVVIDYYRMHLQAEERKREAAIRRAVIEELAREAEKGLYDEDLIFEDAAWRLAKAEGSRFAAWLRGHVEEEG